MLRTIPIVATHSSWRTIFDSWRGRSERSIGAALVFPQWLNRPRLRSETVVDAVYESLYENFGDKRVSPTVAQEAYLGLIQLMEPDVLTVATTNYDSSVVEALQLLGRNPDWGEAARTRVTGGSPPVNIRGLSESASRNRDVVLYLHGKVGWYWKDKGLVSIEADQYSKAFGLPGILLPEPKKNYAQTGFDVMWEEFSNAVQMADRILVLGHSLHDEGIVELLRPKAGVTRVIGWTDGDFEPVEKGIRSRLPGVRCIGWNFGVDATGALGGLFQPWRDGQ